MEGEVPDGLSGRVGTVEKKSGGQEPDVRPHVQGASRGQDDPRDAEAAGADERAEPSTEFAANAELKGKEPADGG
jgi:hypothetical protein